MNLNITTLIIVSTGAFFYWAVSGFKGTFNDYMSRYSDADYKYGKNFWTGFGILAFVVLTILSIVK